MANQFQKKPRILCFHGHASSAKIFKQELKTWPEFVLGFMDLVYIDAPFLTADQSIHNGNFDLPHYEWYKNDPEELNKTFDQAIAYIEEEMIKLGPFDGVLGFSQGAAMAGVLSGMQKQGVALTKVPRIKFVILISGVKLGGSMFPAPQLAKDAFSSPIHLPSLHIIGQKEKILKYEFELLEAFVNPTLMYHQEGHVVPHLDDNGVKIILGFLEKIQGLIKLNIGRNRTCCFCLDFIASLFCLTRKMRMKQKRARIHQSLS